MKVNQFNYKQHTGVATIFTAETDEELSFLENLRSLIENEEGVLSRKSFSFDNGSMSLDIDKKQVKTRKKKDTSSDPAPTNTTRGRGKGKTTNTAK